MPHMCRISVIQCRPASMAVTELEVVSCDWSCKQKDQLPSICSYRLTQRPRIHESHDSRTTSSVHYLHIQFYIKQLSPRSARLIKVIMRPVPMCRCPAQACNSGASASSQVASMLLNIRGAHPIQHSEDKQVQRQTIHRKQVPARPRLQHEPRDLEDGALGQAHALQCSSTFSATESSEWRDVALVCAAITIQGQA